MSPPVGGSRRQYYQKKVTVFNLTRVRQAHPDAKINWMFIKYRWYKQNLNTINMLGFILR